MNVTVSRKLPKRLGKASLIVAVHEGSLLGQAALLDERSDGALSRACERGDATSKLGHCCLLHEVPGTQVARLILIGCGSESGIDERDYRKLCASLGKQLAALVQREAIICLIDDVSVADRDRAWCCARLTLSINESLYRFTRHKGSLAGAAPADSTSGDTARLKKLLLFTETENLKPLRLAAERASATAHGASLARDLGNTAPNVCTPSFLADTARGLASTHANLHTHVIDEKRMERLGMGAFLSVTRGSRQPACLIAMEYNGGPKSEAPVVLVGKGITFDTGGISIKSSTSLDEMKFDMCGAASVFGVMQAIAELQPTRNVTGVVAAAENMPDGAASRPGDVVTTMAGITVEILNTDAEGRMVLCDTLTYIKRYKPAVVIDVATLTGAAVVALGSVASALFSNDDALATELMRAADRSGDLAWRLPLFADYHAQLESPFADLANIGNRGAGAITAACFLSRFTEEYVWAHLDIAGVASRSGSDKGATGRPVPLLMEYLLGS